MRSFSLCVKSLYFSGGEEIFTWERLRQKTDGRDRKKGSQVKSFTTAIKLGNFLRNPSVRAPRAVCQLLDKSPSNLLAKITWVKEIVAQH